MAMDKERLFAYFQTNYLPREEVLFKLPFSVSIDTFWPELLNRRKARAVVLPLRSGNGVPYWYTLTEKMIAASEVLCEKAMLQEKPVDPFRAPMTSAMTEEMFFTSFVEGAQIQITEAMSFLQSGTEPEDIQEQMIWNNQQAWSAMAKSLLRPLDEGHIKGLALLLTSDMNGQADDYRQMDNHPIAAMADLPYTVPPASVIPDRMQEFYDFLRSPDVHPLIKAAAAQAFLLVTRPFPEGNERLSRMVSAAVLLRSGYDFFRDISISSVIARENYRYYKAMKEIIRTENGGDLTYFMEYFMELLVRAVADREERDRRIEQEKHEQELQEQQAVLEREREMAVVPLAPVQVDNPAESIAEKENDPEGSFQTMNDNNVFFLTPPVEEAEPEEVSPDESPPRDIRADYIERFRAIAESTPTRRGSVEKKLDVILRMIDKGMLSFTSADYRSESGLAQKEPFRACRFLVKHGLALMEVRNGIHWYTLYPSENAPILSARPEEKELPLEGVTSEAAFSPAEADEERHESDDVGQPSLSARVLHAIEEMTQNGQETFGCADIREKAGITAKQSYDICLFLSKKAWIAVDNTTRPMQYRLTEAGAFACKRKAENQRNVAGCGDHRTLLMKRLDEMELNPASERDRRVASFLKGIISAGRITFTGSDWNQAVAMSKAVHTSDLRYAMNIGLIDRSETRIEGSSAYEYRICTEIHTGMNTAGLTKTQLQYLVMGYQFFANRVFTADKLSACMRIPVKTVAFHLSNLLDKGLVWCDKAKGRAFSYKLLVNPQSHPECFPEMPTYEKAQEEGSALPAISPQAGYAAAPMRAMTALSV